MFAPPVAKQKSKSGEFSRAPIESQRHHQPALSQVQLLQRRIGNQALLRLFAQHGNEPGAPGNMARLPGVLQTKLRIGAVNDPLEHEADRVADHVMRMPAPDAALSSAPQQVSRKCEECEEEEEKLQMKEAGPHAAAGEAPSSVHEVLRSPGQPLDAATRGFMEPRFGQDFSGVRVHTGAPAAQSARDVNAHAYTVGTNVVFDAGRFAPRAHEGQKLIAHELTHVVQQGFATQAIQRKDDTKKKVTTTPQLVFNEINKRNPDLAALITPQSIDFDHPKEPPAIKRGPLKGGEEHIWKVRITASQAFDSSQTNAGEDKKTKLKSHTQVTHFIDITWALPLAPGGEFIKQTKSEGEAFTLSAAEPLFHELLHARIMMERDPHWTSQHTQLFQDYTKILQIAGSPAVDKERQAVKKQIGVLAVAGGLAKTPADMMKAEDAAYDFLVHEKFDADTESKPFGRTFPNALIAQKYSETVALRLHAGGAAWRGERDRLAAAAAKLFDKLDQAAQTGKPSSPPPAKQ